MRSVIHNIRVLLTDPENDEARSELAWASSMAENGILKIGKIIDFQAHQIEHQLGAYTNCNHGAGLAVIHPGQCTVRFISPVSPGLPGSPAMYGMWSPGKTKRQRLAPGLRRWLHLSKKEIGLPTTFAQLGIPADTDLRAVADSANITAGCCKQLTHEEIYDILLECR